jgi:Icc-related predicted phosphoesterase
MIVVGLADVHGHIASIRKMNDILNKADIILLVGDITNFGKEADIQNVINSLKPQTGKLFAVSGNCDYKEVDRYLYETNINLHGKGEVYNGIGFVGLGGSLITPFQTPNEMTEAEIKDCLEQGASQIPSEKPMILVSHQPPINTRCDCIFSGDHVGSKEVRGFIEKYQPRICFTGHIHESSGVDKINDTYIINSGMLKRGGYAYVEISDEIEKIEIRQIP